MPSVALASLVSAVQEVQDLLAAARMPSGATLHERAARERVIGRSGVVLLSSHFERYIHAVNEEAVAFLNGCQLSPEAFPLSARLLHSRSPIDGMLETQWSNREGALTKFAAEEAWLWAGGSSGTLF